MGRVGIVTDSTVCLPEELVAAHEIVIVPVEVIFGDRTYRDGTDLSPREFYRMLRTAEKLPTTSAPTPGAYYEAFVSLATRVSSILCLTVSSNLSAMYHAALQAREMAREAFPHLGIEVVDSTTAAAAQGLVTLAAARAADRGASLEEMTLLVRTLLERVHFFCLLDTLYYLAKGGRIPKVAYWMGAFLSFKPIIELRGGQIHLLERPRSRGMALERLEAILAERVRGSGALHVAVTHADAPQDALRLFEKIENTYAPAELWMGEFTPVMGTHAGPGVVGIAFYEEDPSDTAPR